MTERDKENKNVIKLAKTMDMKLVTQKKKRMKRNSMTLRDGIR
jgi:hypothetical protein